MIPRAMLAVEGGGEGGGGEEEEEEEKKKKLYMFRTGPPSIIRSLSLCTQQWYVSYRLS
jgi:hypothetical protein